MNKIVAKTSLFIAAAGIAFTAHAGDPSFYDNERGVAASVSDVIADSQQRRAYGDPSQPVSHHNNPSTGLNERGVAASVSDVITDSQQRRAYGDPSRPVSDHNNPSTGLTDW